MPLLERDWFSELRQAATGPAAVRVLLNEAVTLHARTYAIYAVIQAAAATEAGELLGDIKRQRYEGIRSVAEEWSRKPGFARDLLLDRAADMIYARSARSTTACWSQIGVGRLRNGRIGPPGPVWRAFRGRGWLTAAIADNQAPQPAGSAQPGGDPGSTKLVIAQIIIWSETAAPPFRPSHPSATTNGMGKVWTAREDYTRRRRPC
jgi:hypothetical protein